MVGVCLRFNKMPLFSLPRNNKFIISYKKDSIVISIPLSDVPCAHDIKKGSVFKMRHVKADEVTS